MICIYEKRNVQGYQKWYSHVSKAQIQKYKYTKTQIHTYTNTAYDELPERPNMWYIFVERIVQGCQKLYSHVSNTQIQKYKYTNTPYDEVPQRPMCQMCKYNISPSHYNAA